MIKPCREKFNLVSQRHIHILHTFHKCKLYDRMMLQFPVYKEIIEVNKGVPSFSNNWKQVILSLFSNEIHLVSFSKRQHEKKAQCSSMRSMIICHWSDGQSREVEGIFSINQNLLQFVVYRRSFCSSIISTSIFLATH